MRALALIVLPIAFCALGMGAGWWLGARSVTPAGGSADAEDAHAGEEAEGFTPQALANLGVKIENVKPRSFVRTREVLARIEEVPEALRPLVVPVGGVIERVHIRTGQTLAAKAPVCVVLRDPIPRGELTLVGALLPPIREEVHSAVGSLRTAAATMERLQKEITRITPFVKSRAIPEKQRIDLEFQLGAAKQEARNAEAELHHHGLSEAEIEKIAKGAPPPMGVDLWKRALRENGLWQEDTETLWSALLPHDQQAPYIVAMLGELTARGHRSQALSEALTAHDAIRTHFGDAASLLLQGTSLARLIWIAEIGALEPRYTVRAPDGGAPDYDVTSVAARAGQHVSAGDALAQLSDGRHMHLALDPLGREEADVLRLLKSGKAISAEPLIPGTGPSVPTLRLERLSPGPHAEGARALARIPNEVLSGAAPPTPRTWALREGLRYRVRIPVETLEDRYILPTSAVVRAGVDHVVFVQNGNTFGAQPVHVEFSDEAQVVIANDGALFPGDPVAVTGAFALRLALEQSAGGGSDDPHHGHSHD